MAKAAVEVDYSLVLADLFSKSVLVEKLTDRVRDLLKGRQMIQHFLTDRVQNPEAPAIKAVLDKAKALKTFSYLFFGYKEQVDALLASLYPEEQYTSEYLPAKDELIKAQGWCGAGTVLLGLTGRTRDQHGPRVIVEATAEGCTWRYLSGTDVRAAVHDRHFLLPDWIELSGAGTVQEQLDEAVAVTEAELLLLQEFVDYLNNREFLA